MTRIAYRRWLPLLLMILAVAGLGLVACQAAMETKQGGLGEFCNNRDSDCREGYICEAGVCVLAEQAISDACGQMCDKITTCGLEEEDCLYACYDELGATDEDEGRWSDEAAATWADCVVNDLSCEELGGSAEAAANTCYGRLPLEEARIERCQTFRREGEACTTGAPPEDFYSKECIYRARTHDEENWSNTEQCLDVIEFGECDEIVDCLNTTFSLEGEDRF